MSVIEDDAGGGSARQSGTPRSLREQVVAIGERWTAAQYRLVGLVVELDRSGEWAADGAVTCAHWIADALGVEVSTGREWLRIGRALELLPEIEASFGSGRLSYSKVRTLTRIATPDHDAELCRLALDVPAGRLGPVLAAWLAGHEEPEETDHRQRAARCHSWRTDPDGMVAGWYRLPPAAGRELTAAVDAWTMRTPHPSRDVSADVWNGWPSIGQQRADALVALVGGGGSEQVTEIVMHVRSDGTTFDDGTPIPASVVERIAPDSFIRALIHDAEGRPINASGRHRHPTTRQRRVVRERDRVCVDCGGTEFLEYDHEPPYESSGRTVVDELRIRCRLCHRSRHADP